MEFIGYVLFTVSLLYGVKEAIRIGVKQALREREEDQDNAEI